MPNNINIDILRLISKHGFRVVHYMKLDSQMLEEMKSHARKCQQNNSNARRIVYWTQFESMISDVLSIKRSHPSFITSDKLVKYDLMFHKNEIDYFGNRVV